ncbi:CPBP family intramembrane glutamic endopeptidase [Staphylococcus pasteuri]|uniref:CPBP family intramembrane glutamic endopeptidase n=1 Tax=Staphylococcus pasteuri TaxID=45972 RepID=UPI002DB98413|nr:type II CAAX endopeptidase family protein [Staphylococcus pasteuri]MEB6613479.1 CPBP family intramembrane metalloprotease [Staphylococcus pasteuri]
MSEDKTYNLSDKSYLSLLFRSIFLIFLFIIGEVLLITFIEKPLFYIVAVIYLLGVFGFCKIIKIKLFHWNIITKKQYMIIFFSIAVMEVINLVITSISPSINNENTLDNMTSGASILFLFFSFGILVPIIEECIYRALLIKGIFRGFPIIGSIVSIILFTLGHGPTNIWEYLIYGSSSIIYVVTFMKTKRLEVPILIHILNNSLAIFIS